MDLSLFLLLCFQQIEYFLQIFFFLPPKDAHYIPAEEQKLSELQENFDFSVSSLLSDSGYDIIYSGMLVQDPSKGNNDVDAIFDQARQMVAVQGPVDSLRPSSSSRSFTGTGRSLSGGPMQPVPQQPEAIVHNIVCWRNGFTVDVEPLRRLDDPENAPFLEVRLASMRVA